MFAIYVLILCDQIECILNLSVCASRSRLERITILSRVDVSSSSTITVHGYPTLVRTHALHGYALYPFANMLTPLCPNLIAVGALNHKFFVLFIFYTLLTSLQAMVLIVARMVRCGWVHDDDDASDESMPSTGDEQAKEWNNQETAPNEEGLLDPTRMVFHSKYVYPGCDALYQYNLVLILLVASIVFMIFTCGMLIENMEAIETNTGKIARMKMKVGKGGTELSRVTSQFNEMFGGNTEKVAWHWFLPLAVKFPNGMDKVVLGYEWDPTFEPVPFESPYDDDEEEEETFDDEVVTADVIGDSGEPVDLEAGRLQGDPSTPPSLGDTSDDSSFTSVTSKGVRKRDSFREQPTLV